METNISGLYTDYYALTMMQGYVLNNYTFRVVFDMFFRKAPYDGYSLFSGLEVLLDTIQNLHFTQSDIAFLQETGHFTPRFLDYLKNFRFSGSIWAMPEGTVCFPFEPLVRVHAPIAEALLIEGMILNTINYSSVISTKAARLQIAAKNKKVIELGLRRAPGPNGALLASRAAYIGGADATSNVEACKRYKIPYVGTMSHSWVMNFKTELEAFQIYATTYPDNSVFLLDTYDTIKSGLPNAIKVGKTLKKNNKQFGVRLDSGDIDYLSHIVRKGLDAAGFHDAFIVASNNLDEDIISDLSANNCPVDVWGVGTKFVTNDNPGAMAGVYKLCAKENTVSKQMQPRLKISNNIEKTSLPGVKQVYRCYQKTRENAKSYLADIIVTENTDAGIHAGKDFSSYFSHKTVYHPYLSHRKFLLPGNVLCFPLLRCVLKDGRKKQNTDLKTIRDTVRKNFAGIDYSYKRLLNPHVYKVSISAELRELRDELIERKQQNYGAE